MIIETISNSECGVEIKFEDLEPGTVFETEGGNKLLKLRQNEYTVLTFFDGGDWFVAGDGSIVRNNKIVKVWGKLVGLKVQQSQ